MNYEEYYICIDPGSEHSGCVVLGVNDDIHIPDILWVSSRKEGTDTLTKTGKLSKGTTKYNHLNETVFDVAMRHISESSREPHNIVFLIERPESRMAIFDSKTIMATEWTGRFVEKASGYRHRMDMNISELHGIHPSEVRRAITGVRHSDQKEVYVKTREFFDDPDKYEGIKSHARSSLNLYVAYQKMRVEVPHA